MSKTGNIYLITNTVNGKKYVGLTTMSLSRRWAAHKHAALKKKSRTPSLIQRTIAKHGAAAFTIEVVEEAPVERLGDREIEWIAQLGTTDVTKGYNITAGGDRPVITDETRRKQRLARVGRFSGENHSMWGRVHSEDTISKISAANTGKSPSLEARRKMSEAQQGRTHSEETRNKIGAANKGKVRSEDVRTHLSNTRKGLYAGENHPRFGKKHSPESIQKMRDTKLKNKQRKHEQKEDDRICRREAGL